MFIISTVVNLTSKPDDPNHIPGPWNQPLICRVDHRVAAQPESFRRLSLVRLQTTARHETNSGPTSRQELGPSVGRLADADHRREGLQQVAYSSLVLPDSRTSGQQIFVRKMNFTREQLLSLNETLYFLVSWFFIE